MGWVPECYLRKCATTKGVLVEIAHRARARPARVSATSAGASGGLGSGPRLRGHRKHRQLRREFRAVALGTACLFPSVDKRFEMVLTFFADVLENRHGGYSRVPLLRINQSGLAALQFLPDFQPIAALLVSKQKLRASHPSSKEQRRLTPAGAFCF